MQMLAHKLVTNDIRRLASGYAASTPARLIHSSIAAPRTLVAAVTLVQFFFQNGNPAATAAGLRESFLRLRRRPSRASCPSSFEDFFRGRDLRGEKLSLATVADFPSRSSRLRAFRQWNPSITHTKRKILIFLFLLPEYQFLRGNCDSFAANIFAIVPAI